MKVCLICEGSYPYVSGGVASWIQMILKEFSDIDFVIFTIATNKEEMSTFKYELPPSVKSVVTYYISDKVMGKKGKRIKLNDKDKKILRKIVLDNPKDIDWQESFQFIKEHKLNMNEVLMGKDFFDIVLNLYEQTDMKSNFNDFLWHLRGMYFPFLNVLTEEIPDVDIFHSVSTGYAGMIGSVFSNITGKPFILSEHGIYTREREEDIIKADWLDGVYKGIWIDFFKKISIMAYDRAYVVTTLFETNRSLQIELGCDLNKIQIIPNGVDTEIMNKATPRKEERKEYFNIGSILRIVPIKDIKTMLIGYAIAKERQPNIRLNILGNFDEDIVYYELCRQLVSELSIKDVIFHGQVNINEYIMNYDLLLLTSISEGQPLAVLEGLSAGIPFICTNVGNCQDLLEGTKEDVLGRAGFIIPIMDTEALADQIVYCANNKNELVNMGKIGKSRIEKFYKKSDFLCKFKDIYIESIGGK